MTEPERQVARRLLDAGKRRSIQRFVDAGELRLCSGCGAPVECRTPGCKSCWERGRVRSPEATERLKIQNRDWKRRRRQRELAA